MRRKNKIMWHNYKKFGANLLLLTVFIGILVFPITSIAWVKLQNRSVLSIKHERQIQTEKHQDITKEIKVKPTKEYKYELEEEKSEKAEQAPGVSLENEGFEYTDTEAVEGTQSIRDGETPNLKELEEKHYRETQNNIYPSGFEQY